MGLFLQAMGYAAVVVLGEVLDGYEVEVEKEEKAPSCVVSPSRDRVLEQYVVLVEEYRPHEQPEDAM